MKNKRISYLLIFILGLFLILFSNTGGNGSMGEFSPGTGYSGVVGVSAGARVVPVRVLGCNGSGSTSGILSGLNHIAANDEPGDDIIKLFKQNLL